MERLKKARPRSPAHLTPLDPGAQARLAGQVAQIAAALERGDDLPALRDLVTPDPQDASWDAHLMAALGDLKHQAVPPLLAALFGEARDKVRRKALKKALHRLKTRGVPVSADLLPREEVSLGTPQPGKVAVFVSPIFSNGESYVILEGPPEILGGNFLVSRISDREGFQECVLLSIKRKQQAEFWGHFREQGLDEWFSPPPAYAVRLLEEAYTSHPDTGSGVYQYTALREKIFQHWGRPEAAPDWERELPPVPPGERTRLLENSRKLALDPLFLSWAPGPEDIAPWLEKLLAVDNSPLVLSDQQKQVRTDAVLDEATQALYLPETRSDWGQRLRTTAYYLHLQGREEDSRTARVAADDLAVPDRSALAGESPFLRGLVQYALLLAWEVQKPRETESASGLVAPPSDSLLIRR